VHVCVFCVHVCVKNRFFLPTRDFSVVVVVVVVNAHVCVKNRFFCRQGIFCARVCVKGVCVLKIYFCVVGNFSVVVVVVVNARMCVKNRFFC